MVDFVSTAVSGFILGSLYALMALGLVVIYGVSHVFNFAHGIVAVLGGYFTWMFLTFLRLGFVSSVLLSLPVMFVMGWGLYRLAINRLLVRKDWEVSALVFLLGLGIMLENIILQVFGPRVKSIPVLVKGTIAFGSVRIDCHDVVLLLIALGVLGLLDLFFKYTWTGRAIRAVSQSIPGARIVGINVQQVFGYTFGLAFALTGFSGVLLATKYFMTPSIGWGWMIEGFVIVALGGLGSMRGAVYAASVVGIVQAMTTRYAGALWVWPLWFATFLGVLLLRPQGLGGGRW
jgi:branched-chain amino acid transport system permease protein